MGRIAFVCWCLIGIGLVHADARAQGEAENLIPQHLRIDDCPVKDPGLTDAQLRQRGGEHYTRGETLYIQGDYKGAVEELIASYCLIPYYSILKDIGQAYERDLDFELAVAYLERYVRDIPPDAKRTSQCAADPQEDRANVSRRVSVLRRLPAKVLVQTDPDGAQITISNGKTAGRRTSGQELTIVGDTYKMTIEKPGYVTVTKTINVRIGKPYTYFEKLTPLTGKLSVQVSPADARIFLDNKLVGLGRYEMDLAAKTYTVMSEAPNRLTVSRRVEVLPNRVNRVQVELTPRPQFARRQLILYATIGGGVSSGLLTNAFDDTSIAFYASLGGAIAALGGSYFYLPDDVPLGTSNLTITSSVAGGIAGSSATLLFTGSDQVAAPVAGAGMIAGAAAGYYLGERTKIRPGDAALINSSLTWGTVAGSLFALSFDPPREIAAGLVLSGVGMGAIGGVLMTSYFDISRTHALLIDVGGIVGILGGLAAESIVYPATTTGDEPDSRTQEHIANFALAGMAVGLVGAGILTRNIDAPKIVIQPSINKVTTPSGTQTTFYGVMGAF
jgi:hypothetical protein